MSKMPAKKKSCFQITSVTQAQVAASSITDDTESLDDPDESRTEDVSSEIFDVSRATDFEQEGVCERSSSEETLNNVGETEAAAAAAAPAAHIPQDGQLQAATGPPNGGFALRSTALTGSIQGDQHVLGAAAQPPNTTTPPAPTPTTPAGVVQQLSTPVGAGGPVGVAPGTSPAPPPAAAGSSASAVTACSSRFRVIKLDHGTGEPFRRGRWTCTEFYERDSEGSVIARTVDSIKHASTLDHNADRDSGLGATGGSVAAPGMHSVPGPDLACEGSFAAMSHLQQVEQQQQQQQSYGVGLPNVSGPMAHSAFQPPGYPALPAVAQGLLPHAHSNGMSVPLPPVQKLPGGPPAASQSQQFAYPAQPQQLPPGHLLPGQQPPLMPSSQSDYRQQQHAPAPQALPVASLPVGQGPSPVMTPAAGGTPVLGLPGEPPGPAAGVLPGGQMPPAALGPLQQAGGGGVPQAAVGSLPGAVQGQPLPPAGQASGAGGGGLVSGGSPSVPTTVPAASSTPVSMPNALPALGPPQAQGPQGGAPVGGLVMPGPGGAVLPQGFGQFPAQTAVGQAEGNRRKSDALPQPLATSGKDPARPLATEPLQLPAATPVNNLTPTVFGIPIPIDGDEDSTSGASVVAIDNKIEQAMDLVKSHLMYAVREEVEVLKEQIKELYERNSVLERENALLKSLANTEQLSQLSVQIANPSGTPPPGPAPAEAGPPAPHQQPNASSA
ncbi:TSC22 domain family protein 2 isoform X2 [Lepisosteus oculatus]|uniref:TSC22 domain family protein 2 isoform X2 n=1 Tax=Lepisosteus oculatus TaxID=7918 RepID=UPI0035F50DCE